RTRADAYTTRNDRMVHSASVLKFVNVHKKE
uniref:ShKT domain-containing protein n=1 Tax=Parascaris univalens TaxID=6257 RepID=A0A915C426_PARUN